MSRPRAAFIAPAMPARSGNGLAMRLGLFLEALARVADTELFVLPIAGPATGSLPDILGVRTTSLATHLQPDTRFRLLKQLPDAEARLVAFRSYGRGSRHAAVSHPLLGEIRRLTSDDHFDLVHCGRLYVSEAALAVAGTSHTLDLDEDDAWAWRHAARLQQADDPDASHWAAAEAEAEDRLLGRIGPRFAQSFIAGPLDRQRIGERLGLWPEVVANAVDVPPLSPRADDGRTIVFLGTLGYQPNVEGITWFVERVLPIVTAVLPARFIIAGRGMPPAIAALRDHPFVELAGEVASVDQVYRRASLAIAPMLSGGGTRIKVIEAAAHGVPVVSSAIGNQGLDFGHDEIWLADTPDDFAAAIVAALSDPAGRERRRRSAHAMALAHHERSRVIDTLAMRFESLLHRARNTA